MGRTDSLKKPNKQQQQQQNEITHWLLGKEINQEREEEAKEKVREKTGDDVSDMQKLRRMIPKEPRELDSILRNIFPAPQIPGIKPGRTAFYQNVQC